MIFHEKLDTCHGVPNCFRTHIPKFNFLNLEQGLRIFLLIASNHQQHQNVEKNYFKPAPKIVFLLLGQEQICSFGSYPKFKQILISNFLFGDSF